VEVGECAAPFVRSIVVARAIEATGWLGIVHADRMSITRVRATRSHFGGEVRAAPRK
jgi:hypothetical protein